MFSLGVPSTFTFTLACAARLYLVGHFRRFTPTVGWQKPKQHKDLIAMEIHTHAEASFWRPFGHEGEACERAADKLFGSDRRPTGLEAVAFHAGCGTGQGKPLAVPAASA